MNDVSTHYVNYGKVISSIPFVITGDIPSFQYQTSEVLMMTGASDNHAYGSFNCLYSMVLADPYASYLYIDLGIADQFRNKLFAHFETIHEIQKKMKSTGFIGYRKVNWNSFPKWMHLKGGRERGGYSWKVFPFVDAFLSWKAITFWLDGGNLIQDGISRELTYVHQEGIYTPPSPGNAGKWTHPGSIDFLLKHHFIKSFDKEGTNGCGGHLIVDWSNKTIMNRVIIPYRQCAYTQKCISPRESNMENHRQDQAILSALIRDLGVIRSLNGKYRALPALRQERGNIESECTKILNNYLISIQNTYQIKINNKYYKANHIQYSILKYKYVSRPVDETWNPV